jgi:hypothetical protein
MTTRQQLISQLDSAYQQFRSAAEKLEERQFEHKFIDGKWGAREIVAHIAGWHGEMGGGLERMSRGEKPQPEGANWNDFDSTNATFAEHAKGKTKDQVLHELDAAVNHFKEAAMKLPEDRFGEGKTANKMFEGAGIEHFQEHMEHLRQAATQKVGASA